MSSREQDMNKCTPVGPQYIMAETIVTKVCNQLSNIPYIFRHCDLLVLNKSREKNNMKYLQVNYNSFTDCHTEGIITKAN